MLCVAGVVEAPNTAPAVGRSASPSAAEAQRPFATPIVSMAVRPPLLQREGLRARARGRCRRPFRALNVFGPSTRGRRACGAPDPGLHAVAPLGLAVPGQRCCEAAPLTPGVDTRASVRRRRRALAVRIPPGIATRPGSFPDHLEDGRAGAEEQGEQQGDSEHGCSPSREGLTPGPLPGAASPSLRQGNSQDVPPQMCYSFEETQS